MGLFGAFVWFSLRLVFAVRDRFAALAAFGLTLSVALQAMVHLQVVTQLAPPKGMALPFLSDGGSSLLASCLAAGLALATTLVLLGVALSPLSPLWFSGLSGLSPELVEIARSALPFGFLGDEEDAPPARERTPRPSEKDTGRPEKGARPPEDDTEPIPTFAKVTPKESPPPTRSTMSVIS